MSLMKSMNLKTLAKLFAITSPDLEVMIGGFLVVLLLWLCGASHNAVVAGVLAWLGLTAVCATGHGCKSRAGVICVVVGWAAILAVGVWALDDAPLLAAVAVWVVLTVLGVLLTTLLNVGGISAAEQAAMHKALDQVYKDLRVFSVVGVLAKAVNYLVVDDATRNVNPKFFQSVIGSTQNEFVQGGQVGLFNELEKLWHEVYIPSVTTRRDIESFWASVEQEFSKFSWVGCVNCTVDFGHSWPSAPGCVRVRVSNKSKFWIFTLELPAVEPIF